MGLKWRDKILLVKLEDTYGVDPNPTGAANAVLAVDVSLTPMEGNDVSRDLETPYLGAQATIPTELHMKLAYKVELQGSGAAGTAPAWGPLLRACAVAEVIDPGVSVTYNPVSDDHESVTQHLWISGTQYKLTGCRGTVKLSYTAQGIPYLEFAFSGLFTKPGEVARPVPDLTAFQKPLVVADRNTPTFTLGGTDFVMRSCMLDLGNAVEARFLVNSESIEITDRSDVLEAKVEAVRLTTFDPFDLAASQAAVAHMPGAFGKGTTFNMLNWVVEKGYEGDEPFQKYHARKLEEQ